MICPKCSEDFVRVQSARVYCYGMTKLTSDIIIYKWSESQCNEVHEKLSEEKTDLKHVIKEKDEGIQKLTEEVSKLDDENPIYKCSAEVNRTPD